VLIELDENRGQAVVYEVTPDGTLHRSRRPRLGTRWRAWLALVERYGGRRMR
jgi:hypothetical protein